MRASRKTRTSRRLACSAASATAALLLLACVERAVTPDRAAPIRAESFAIPFEVQEADLGAVARLRLQRLHELVQQGLHEEAKAELALLSEEPEVADLVETLERWDRYLDGCIAWSSLHGSAAPLGGERHGADAPVVLELELLTAGELPIEIPARGASDGEYRGEDETSFFKLRLTEVEFDGLGARASTVRWETLPLAEDLRCGSASSARVRFELAAPGEVRWALKLVRIDATLYPCAARVGERYVPLRPLPYDPAVVVIYPEGWRALEGDPLLALRAACASEAAIYDRHALIAASLLPRGGEEERSAFEFLQVASAQSAPRVRAKAGAALEWLRLDREALFAEATRLAPTRSKELRPRTARLLLPGQ